MAANSEEIKTVKERDKIGYKVAVLSEPESGKVSLVTSLVMQKKNGTVPDIQSTGVLFHNVSYEDLNLEVWDITGKKTSWVYPVYVKDASACMLVFDLMSQDSYDKLEDWITQVKQYNHKCNIILVGTKTNLETAQVTAESIEDFKNKHNISRYETVDAANKEDIEKIFASIAKNIRANINKAPGKLSKFEEGRGIDQKPRTPEPTCYKPPTCSIC